jgi:hypothetical protein
MRRKWRAMCRRIIFRNLDLGPQRPIAPWEVQALSFSSHPSPLGGGRGHLGLAQPCRYMHRNSSVCLIPGQVTTRPTTLTDPTESGARLCENGGEKGKPFRPRDFFSNMLGIPVQSMNRFSVGRYESSQAHHRRYRPQALHNCECYPQNGHTMVGKPDLLSEALSSR